MPCYSFNLKMVLSSKEHFLRRGERGRFLVALGVIQGTGLLSLFTRVCYSVIMFNTTSCPHFNLTFSSAVKYSWKLSIMVIVRKIAASHFKVPFAHYDARHAASPLAPVHTNFNIASWTLQFGRGREVAWPGLGWPGLVVRGARLRSSHHTAALSSLVTRAGSKDPRGFHNHGVPSSLALSQFKHKS